MRAAVLRYRVMAYVTGVVLMVLCFVGIPLQIWGHSEVVASDVGTAHGILYIIYLVAAYLLSRKLALPLASPATVILLLAGTIPVLTFVVERWVTRRYINPALAAGAAGQPVPDSAVPDSTAPGSTVPGSTVPGSTVPGSTGPARQPR